MARYLMTIAVIAIAVIIVVSSEDGPPPDSATPADVSTDAATLAEPLPEIDVAAARRTTVFEACDASGDQDPWARLNTEWERTRRQMLRVLGASGDAEHLLVAALVSWKEQPAEALQLLDKAEAIDPHNALVAAQLLELCMTITSCTRARPAMERNLIQADKANGLAWVQVARSRLERLDQAGALAAMRQAVAAAQIEDHFIDYVLLFDRGLASSADLQPFDRMIGAFGFAAAVFTATPAIVQHCRDRGGHSAEWRNVCLRLGERLEHHGRSNLTRSLGMSLQAIMYEFEGDTRQQEEVKRRERLQREAWSLLAQRAAGAEALRDATLLRRYLEVFEASDELTAAQFLADEVEARIAASPAAQPPGCNNP